MNPFKKRPGADALFLAAVWITISASTIVWTSRDRTPPPWDPADHLTAAYDYAQPLARADFGGFSREFFAEHHYYAPLVHLVTASFYLVLGASRLSGIAVNLLSMALLLYSVYWIGRKLYGRPNRATAPISGEHGISGESEGTNGGAIVAWPRISPAAFAAVLATSYHFMAWLIHDAFLDYPLTAVVAASFALLINAGDFRTKRNAIWFGIAMGLGLLTKQTFGFFLALPILYCTIRAFVSLDWRAILNLALSGLIAAAIAALWYWPHMQDVIDIYRVNRQGAIDENEAPLFSFMSNVFYLHGLVSSQMQLFFGLLFAFGLLYSIVRFRGQSVMLYMWLASGIAAFTFIANKDMRYTVPVLPAAALISVCWAFHPGSIAARSTPAVGARLVPILKRGLSLLVLGWAGVGFFNAQWPRTGSGVYIDTPRFRWMVFARNYFGFDHAPLDDDWSVPEIVKATAALGLQPRLARTDSFADLRPIGAAPYHLAEPGANESPQPTLGVIVNLPYLNPSNISLYARLLASKHGGRPLINVEWLVDDSGRPRIMGCDYILVRTGLAEADWVSPMERYAEQEIRSQPGLFVRVARFPVPLRNAEAVIYKCNH